MKMQLYLPEMFFFATGTSNVILIDGKTSIKERIYNDTLTYSIKQKKLYCTLQSNQNL